MLKIEVHKTNEVKNPNSKMKNVPAGHLVQVEDDDGLYAITGTGGTALLLTYSSENEWFEIADGYLNEEVKVIGKIKGIVFEVE